MQTDVKTRARRCDVCTRRKTDTRGFQVRVDGRLYGGLACDGCAATITEEHGVRVDRLS